MDARNPVLFKAKRLSLSLSLERLGKISGVSSFEIGLFERGKIHLDNEKLIALLKILAVLSEGKSREIH